jgi:hypothetical protein
VERSRDTLAVYQPFDYFFQKMESEYKQAEKKCFVDGGIKQRFVFVLVANVYGLSYEDHFRDHQGVDQCGSIGEVRNMEPAEQENAVGRERAKEKSQIQEDDSNFPEFMGSPLLQAGFLGI